MTDAEMLLPPDPLPTFTVYDQFFLRQKAKRITVVQLCTDVFFVGLIIHYYVRFLLPHSCPPDTVNCTHFEMDFKEIWNGSNPFSTGENSLSGQEKALLTAAFTVLLKTAVIAECWSSMHIFDGFTREADLHAAKLTRNYYILRFFSSFVEVLMHFVGGISLRPTTPIEIVRLVFFVYPVFQMIYVLAALWGYCKMMIVMAQCLQGSYGEELEVVEFEEPDVMV